MFKNFELNLTAFHRIDIIESELNLEDGVLWQKMASPQQ